MVPPAADGSTPKRSGLTYAAVACLATPSVVVQHVDTASQELTGNAQQDFDSDIFGSDLTSLDASPPLVPSPSSGGREKPSASIGQDFNDDHSDGMGQGLPSVGLDREQGEDASVGSLARAKPPQSGELGSATVAGGEDGYSSSQSSPRRSGRLVAADGTTHPVAQRHGHAFTYGGRNRLNNTSRFVAGILPVERAHDDDQDESSVVQSKEEVESNDDLLDRDHADYDTTGYSNFNMTRSHGSNSAAPSIDLSIPTSSAIERRDLLHEILDNLGDDALEVLEQRSIQRRREKAAEHEVSVMPHIYVNSVFMPDAVPGGSRIPSRHDSAPAPQQRANNIAPQHAAQRVASQMPAGGFLQRVMDRSTASADPEGAERSASPDQQRNVSPGKNAKKKQRRASSASEVSYASSTSSAASSASSTTKQRKKLKKKAHKRWRRNANALKNAKCPEPSTYDGSTNFDLYEAWMYETEQWLTMSGIPRAYRVAAIKRFLSGKAAKWFMTFVALHVQEWTMDKVFIELFNYCFPPNFKRLTRQRFNSAIQGNRSVRDFAQHLRSLAARIGEVTELQLRMRFWDGVQGYLRIKWADSGYDPEVNSMAELEESADRFELAQKQTQIEQQSSKKKDDDRSRRPPGGNANDRNDTRDRFPSNSAKDRGSKRTNERDQRQQPGSSSKPTKNDSRGKQQQHSNKYNASKKELDQLRADGKCFTCKEVGHTARDCPTANTAPRPLIRVNAVTLKKIDKLVKARDRLRVNVLSFVPNQDSDAMDFDSPAHPHLPAIALATSAVYRLAANGPYSTHERPITGDHRFSMTPEKHASRFHIEDLALFKFGATFTAEDLYDPEWDIVDWYRGLVRFAFFADGQADPQDVSENNNRLAAASRVRFITFLLNNSATYLADPEEPVHDPDRWVGTIANDLYTFTDSKTRLKFTLCTEELWDKSGDIVAKALSGATTPDPTPQELNFAHDTDAETESCPTTPKPGVPTIRVDSPGSVDAQLQTSGVTSSLPLDEDGDPVFHTFHVFSADFEVHETWTVSTADEHARFLLQVPKDAIVDVYPDETHIFFQPPVTPQNETVDPADTLLSSPIPWKHNVLLYRPATSLPERIPMHSEDKLASFLASLPEDARVEHYLDDTCVWLPFDIDEDDPAEDARDLPGLMQVSDSSDDELDLGATPIIPERVRLQMFGSSDSEEHYTLPNTAFSMDIDSSDSESEDGDSGELPERFAQLFRGRSPTTRRTQRTSPIQDSGDDADNEDNDPVLEDLPVNNTIARKYPDSDDDNGSSGFASSTISNLGVFMARVQRQPNSNPEPGAVNTMRRNGCRPKDNDRLVPNYLVVRAKVNGKEVEAMIDSGSTADIMSSTLAVQLKLNMDIFSAPLKVQMATSGSLSHIQASVKAAFEFSEIKETRRFDIMNVDSFDLILGTPFLFSHKVVVGFNPSQIAIGSVDALPIKGVHTSIIASRMTQIVDYQLDDLRERLTRAAEDLCKSAADTPLPPLRAVNHEIPWIDENKVHPWRPSKCPEALKPLWRQKKQEYIRTGRWKVATGPGAAPMLILKKKAGPDGELKIRTVFDKRSQNANTKKMASPLPDIETILRNAASHRFRSLIDGKDAYEQIRVVPEHVNRTLFNTPDGTMVSLVLQQGDCNGGATYQALMNHIFAPYIGVFMDVYLDDIVIYSDSVEDHIKHLQIVFDVLRKEKLYLSASKMQFFVDEMTILGNVITNEGIKIDPHKVDSIAAWKTPTNKDLLAGFIGTVGFVARGCQGIRVPMAALTRLTGANSLWKWGPTEQRAFDRVKMIVQDHRDVHTVSVSDDIKAGPLNLATDASLTGGGGVLSQGHDLNNASYIAFWSGKFTNAQQNYGTHERELLALVESLRRFRHLLIGRKFRVFTDHEALKWLDSQKNLSHRQLRWLKEIQEFDYEIHYLPGPQNVVGDALSRMYSDEPKGTVRAQSEYVSNDTDDEDAPKKAFRPYLVEPLDTGAPVLASFAAIIRGDDEPAPVDPPEVTLRRSARTRKAPTPDDVIVPPHVVKPRGPRKPKEPQPQPHPNNDRVTELQPDSQTTSKLRESTIVPVPNPKEDAHLVLEGASNAEIPIPDGAPEPTSSPNDASPTPEIVKPITPTVTETPLLDISTSISDGLDLLKILRGNYVNDSFFDIVLADPKSYRNFLVEDDLVYLTDDDKKLLCIPDILVDGRKLRETLASTAHSVLAHLGSNKTLLYLREHMWWPKMRSDVAQLCASCPTCSTSKPRTQTPYGTLRSLDAPSYPWQVIGIDFVGPLPESKTRTGTYDMLCVIIDHLTSMVHLVPTKNSYRAKDIAEVVFEHVYKLHGLPEAIVSDRDSLFTSIFWQHLHSLLGTDLKMSSAYHPQTDGATERANRTITQMLRQAIHPTQKDWAQKIPGIEFALNSATTEPQGAPPFVLNSGRLPSGLIFKTQDAYPGVRVFAERMKNAILSAHDAIIESRVKMTHQANKHRQPAPFQLNDLVYVSTKNMKIPKFRARKLVPKYIGPMRITRVVSAGSSFLLDLPDDLKQRGIHPVFHASLLRPHVPNDDRRFPGRQVNQFIGFEEDPKEWAVDRIVSHSGKGRSATFKLRWKTGDETWAEYRTVAKLDALKSYFEAIGIEKISELVDSERPQADAIGVRVSRFAPEMFIKGNGKSIVTPTTQPVPTALPRRSISLLRTRLFRLALPPRTMSAPNNNDIIGNPTFDNGNAAPVNGNVPAPVVLGAPPGLVHPSQSVAPNHVAGVANGIDPFAHMPPIAPQATGDPGYDFMVGATTTHPNTVMHAQPVHAAMPTQAAQTPVTQQQGSRGRTNIDTGNMTGEQQSALFNVMLERIFSDSDWKQEFILTQHTTTHNPNSVNPPSYNMPPPPHASTAHVQAARANDKANGLCFHCHKHGHTRRDCRARSSGNGNGNGGNHRNDVSNNGGPARNSNTRDGRTYGPYDDQNRGRNQTRHDDRHHQRNPPRQKSGNRSASAGPSNRRGSRSPGPSNRRGGRSPGPSKRRATRSPSAGSTASQDTIRQTNAYLNGQPDEDVEMARGSVAPEDPEGQLADVAPHDSETAGKGKGRANAKKA